MPEILNELELTLTGETTDTVSDAIGCARLKTGWNLVIADRSDRLIEAGTLGRLSKGCEVVASFVEEHVMFSQATGWIDGNRTWTITHEAEKSIDHIGVDGQAPSITNSIWEQQKALQAQAEDVDHLFDVPVKVTRELVGYAYDEDLETEDSSSEYELLSGSLPATPRKSFFSKIFGK